MSFIVASILKNLQCIIWNW